MVAIAAVTRFPISWIRKDLVRKQFKKCHCVRNLSEIIGPSIGMLSALVVHLTTYSAPNPEAVTACAALNMSLKFEMMGGFGKIDGYSRNSGCGYVCGRRTYRWDNGPQGFGDGTLPGTSTQWPSTLNMGATFDPKLALEWGTAMGEEFWGKGTNIQEGPGINIARVMKNGRNFEYVSGEDPILGSVMVAEIIDGIQQNVMAIAKHYMLNNQETSRSGENNIVDEKTMMELYGVPFGAAAPKVAGYMCAYNRINGVWACENKDTLKTMLKGRYNFSGFVVSDWGACHTTDGSLLNGLDIEMPHADHMSAANIQAALDSKLITPADVNDRCERVLSGWFNLPKAKRYPCDGKICINNNVSTPANKLLARKLSAMSTVLLKNDGAILPITSRSMKIALIGIDATDPYTGGSGSGSVSDHDKVSPFDAFTNEHFTQVTANDGKDADAAVKAATAADIAIIFGSAHTGEGHDRKTLNLDSSTADIDALIPKICAAQKKCVVVMSVPGSILTDWRDSVPAILWNGLPGEQVGPAIVDILIGNVIPQAKLPITLPNIDNEQKFTVEQYPGIPNVHGFPLEVTYTEGQIVGYRWYDKHNVKPAFAFGHGLSYGAVTYGSLVTTSRTVSWKLTQPTEPTTCETSQLYIGYPSASSDPLVPTKVLRYFEKQCGADIGTELSYTLTDRDVSNWDVEKKVFTVTKGVYKIYVCSSSQDIRLTGSITV